MRGAPASRMRQGNFTWYDQAWRLLYHGGDHRFGNSSPGLAILPTGFQVRKEHRKVPEAGLRQSRSSALGPLRHAAKAAQRPRGRNPSVRFLQQITRKSEARKTSHAQERAIWGITRISRHREELIHRPGQVGAG